MDSFVRDSLHFAHKLPLLHLLAELNTLKGRLKPAFPDNTIRWFSDNSFFSSLSSFTLFEVVPQKGVRRFLGFKYVELATFTRETLFASASLKVHDPRVTEYLNRSDPALFHDFAHRVATRCYGQKELSIEIAAQ